MLLNVGDALLWLLYAAFWGAAGVAKALELKSFAISVLAYGIVPERLVDAFSLAVVAAECAVPALLLWRRTRAGGAALSLSLLALFTAAAVHAMLQGRFHECGCRIPLLSSTTVGPHLLLRNLLLGAWGGFLLWRHSGARAGSPLAAAAGRLWEERWRLAQGALLLVMLATILNLKGRLALLERDPGRVPLTVGSSVAPFAGERVDGGGRLAVGFGPGERPRILILFSADCNVCNDSAASWEAWSREEGERTEFIGVCAGDPASARRFAELHRLTFPVLTVPIETWLSFRTATVPLILRLAPEGKIAEIRRRR